MTHLPPVYPPQSRPTPDASARSSATSAFGEPNAYPSATYPSSTYPSRADASATTPYPYAPPGDGSRGDGSTRARRGPGWAGVGVAALAAATAASLATAGLTGAFEQDATSSLAALGRQEISIPVSGSTADNPDWQVVAAAVRDSVVAITVSTPSGGGEGSGVVIDEAGLILTNDHVVGDVGRGSITVTLADGRLFEATLVGTDPTTDIAVIRLVEPPADLAAATLGDSDEVVVGAAVMAVGNPLGLDSTVTTGIVSAVDRPVSTREQGSNEAVVTNAIQVDAAVNPGNSGGPLFSSAGEVIGINASIATLSGSSSGSGSIGLGFAIPINQARLVADQLIESGTAEHAYLGVRLSDGTASAAGETRRGAVVRSVEAGTPAAAADLRDGDVIVGIDGRGVDGAESLTGFVRQHAAGDEVVLTVVRDGAAIDVAVTLATSPSA